MSQKVQPEKYIYGSTSNQIEMVLPESVYTSDRQIEQPAAKDLQESILITNIQYTMDQVDDDDDAVVVQDADDLSEAMVDEAGKECIVSQSQQFEANEWSEKEQTIRSSLPKTILDPAEAEDEIEDEVE